MMAKGLRNKIKNSKIFGAAIVGVYRYLKSIFKIPPQFNLYCKTKKIILAKSGKVRVYYIGVPAHNNLGDLAQGVCIRHWLKKYYGDREIVEIETNALVNTRFSVLKLLKDVFNDEDIIIFQSGYTTTDLGGYADDMHCAVIKILPKAKILMMPQTVFFEKEERKKNTSKVYNSAENMLFLARDRISFRIAEEMFPDLSIRLYPDIVTTLIGQYQYTNERNGILFCCRDDSEKYYSDDEINKLMNSCREFANVELTDTTKNVRFSEIVKNAEIYIMSEIERYSKYNLIITDRYHGTIFSLVAGTPVIIIKTTDYKVTTGAEWFKGVYDDYVYLADSLDDALGIAKDLYDKERNHIMKPYFEEEYYSKLKSIFQNETQKKGGHINNEFKFQKCSNID